MSEINFRPWIGKNYQSSGYKGKRILVLGESHHCGNLGLDCPSCKKENLKDDCFSFTEDVLNTILYGYTGEPYMQTFLCFERAIVGRKMTQEEREEFWQGVIFYNYIQYAQSAARQSPQPEHWAKSECAFKELLEEYLPDYIIVWGVRLYGGLPNWNGESSILQINEKAKTDVWTYNIKGKRIPAIKVHHPSSPSGKRWIYWHEFYKEFLHL
jgi:hypothetical protein